MTDNNNANMFFNQNNKDYTNDKNIDIRGLENLESITLDQVINKKVDING